MTDEATRYMKDPGTLVDVVREVVEGLREGAGDSNLREAEGQLREVSRVIEKMEKKMLPVTDHLRHAKMDLLARIDQQRGAQERLETLLRGLSETLSGTVPGKPREAMGPKISEERLRDVLLSVLRELEGGGYKQDVRDRMGELLSEELSASDRFLTRSGRPSWSGRTGRIVGRLKREGVLHRNSPNGPAPKGWWVLVEKKGGDHG